MRRGTWRSCSRSLASAAVSLALALAAAAARGDEGWLPSYTADGVSVSERPAAGRALPDFRGEVEIPADAYEVLAVIVDVAAQTKWMWACLESRIVARESDSTSVVYQVIDAPWPVTDRDVVLRSQTRVLAPGRLSVRFATHSDPAVPPVPGLVRMARLDGEFELVALDPTHTRVTYTVAADPAGSLPQLIARRTVRESPFDTLVGLRRRVAETHGQYARAAQDWRSRAPEPR